MSEDRSFHHTLPPLPGVPADRDPSAPVDVLHAEAFFDRYLQDLDVRAERIRPEEQVFLDAWVRAALARYAPGAAVERLEPAEGHLVLVLADGDASKRVSLYPGRSRPGVLSEDEYLEVAPCDLVAISCPVWTTLFPPTNLAYLASYLKPHGFTVEPVDLNLWLYRATQRANRHDLLRMWRSQADFAMYADEADWAEEMMLLFGHKIDVMVKSVLASRARVVGFTTYSSNVELTLRVADRVKQADPTIKVLVGGAGSTVTGRFVQRNGIEGLYTPQAYLTTQWRTAPEFYRRLLTSPSVDHLIVGEGEITILGLMNALRAGEDPAGVPGVATVKDGVFHFRSEEVYREIDQIPYPDWRRLHPARYGRPDHLPFWFSRGCINRCAFCTNNAYFYPGYRCRGARNAVDELWQMQEQFGTETFAFADLECNGDLEGLERFMDLLLAEGPQIKWHSYAVIRPDMPQHLIEKCVQSGNIRFEYGFESGCDSVLKAMNKTYNSADAERIIRWTSEAGGHASVNMVVGFPGETEEHVDETLAFMERNAPYIGRVASMNAFIAMPHAKVLEEVEKRGLLVGHDYCDWRTKDNTNNSETRLRRVERVCHAIDQFGILHAGCYDLAIEEESAESALNRRHLQGTGFAKKGWVQRGPLRVNIEDNLLKILYEGQPITSGLHLYTSVQFEGEGFLGSNEGSWVVQAEGHRLRAAITWPKRRISQVWWLSLLSPRRLRLVVEILTHIRVVMEHRQTCLMVPGAYRDWRVADERGTFPETFPDEGCPWDCQYAVQGVKQVELAPADGMPGLLLTPEELRSDIFTGVVVTDSCFESRMLQLNLMDNDKVFPGKAYYFKGELEILEE